jgi:RNA polymerase sigma-70 factor (ECF subfamily)
MPAATLTPPPARPPLRVLPGGLLPWRPERGSDVGSAASASSESDEALVEKLRKGEPAALRALMERYRGPLFGYLARLLGSPDDADDLFQDTFVRVLRGLERFDPKRAFRPWLYAIATNLVRNAWRSRGYRDALSLDRPEGDDDDAPAAVVALAGRGPLPGDVAVLTEDAARVREAIGELPEKGRAALLLFYYQGLSYDEVALALEIPVGTVKSRIHNAVARLARTLGATSPASSPGPEGA